jgi:RNA polymerase sigma-70 factor (ECF subfamily)
VDRTTLDRLVRAHLPAALRFATRLSGDADAAEDVVQDALARVARSWGTFRGDATFRTWLFGIVVNAFRDRLDAQRRAGRLDGGAVSDDVPDTAAVDPAAAAEAGELGRRVARLVSSLPPRQREVLVMVAYEQMTTADVAAALGVTEQNVRATLHAARARLRERLAPYLAEQRRAR